MNEKVIQGHGPFIRALFAALVERGVPHCVLRNWQGLPVECGNDLDVFVDAAKLELATSSLIKTAAAHKLIACRKTAKYGFISYDFYSWGTSEILKIDLFTKIHFQGLETISSEKVLSDLLDHNGIAIANASTANFINSYKDILDSGIIKEKYRAGISSALENGDRSSQLRKNLVATFGEQGPALICKVLAGRGVPDGVLAAKLRSLLRRNIYQRAPFGSLVSQVTALWQRLTHRRRRLKSERLTIALLGPDGSGKSTICELFGACLIPPNQEIVYKHGRPGYVPSLREVSNKVLKFFHRPQLMPNPKGVYAVQGNVHGKAMASIYVAYYFWDFWLDEIVFKLSQKGSVRIFDRYWYDYFFLPSFVNLPKGMNVFLSILPPADLLFILIADPEEIYGRKKELSLAQIEFQNKRALSLAVRCREARLIRTDGSVESTTRAIAEAIGLAR